MSMLRPLIRRSCLRIPHLRPVRAFATSVDPQQTEAPDAQQAPDNTVRIVEVGPRDGLQNEKKTIPLATKIQLIEKLSKTGLTDIEAGSFVPAKWVPQMADSEEIMKHLIKDHQANPPPNPIYYSFLVPNLKGFENAFSILEPLQALKEKSKSEDELAHPNMELAVFASATESFSQKNLNCSVADSLQRFDQIIGKAKDANLRIRAYISVVLGCPFEGYEVDPHRVAEIAASLLESGADEIALGDTTGMGTVPRTATLLNTLKSAGIRMEDLAMHFHDTYGQALVNTAVSLEHGIRTFDASVAGLGGCPFSPGATGNVGMEDMVYFLESLGMDTGLDLNMLADVGEWIVGELGVPNASRVGKAWLARKELSESQTREQSP